MGLNSVNDTIALDVKEVTVSAGPAPTFTTISTASGTTAGGTGVIITGTNLIGATAVTFGGVAYPATGVTVVNANTITAFTPAHAVGLVNVVVTTPGGTATGTNVYTYVLPPLVANFTWSPGSAPQNRIQVTDTSTGGAPTYVVTRDWNWGDGTAHGSGASPTHDYAIDGGSYDVTLTITRTVDSATSIITKTVIAP